MKKIYNSPIINVDKMQTAEMIATSDFNDDLGGDGGNGSGALSRRRHSVWDEDEDEYI